MHWSFGQSFMMAGVKLAAVERNAVDPSEGKAYVPDQRDLAKLMSIESDAAVNVEIRKGSEVDVINSFATDQSETEGKCPYYLCDRPSGGLSL